MRSPFSFLAELKALLLCPSQLCSPPWVPPPAGTGPKHLDELVTLRSLVQSLLSPPAWQLRGTELVSETALRPNGPHPQRGHISLGGEILLKQLLAS